MANEQNLKGNGFDEITASKQREIASAGGKASAESRRKRKTLRETYMEIAKLPLAPSGTLSEEFAEKYKELSGEEINVDAAIMLAQIYKAACGDTQAATFIRDTIGEKSAEVVDSTIKIALQGDIKEFAG